MSTTDGHEHHERYEHGLWRRFVAAAELQQAGGRDCPDLASWLDGRASEAESERVESHLAGCAVCRAAVELTRAMDAEATLPAAPPQVVEAARVLVAAAAISQAPTGSMRIVDWMAVRRVAGWSLAAAASLAVCLVGYRIGVGMPAGGSEDVDRSLALFGMDEALQPQLQVLLDIDEEAAP